MNSVPHLASSRPRNCVPIFEARQRRLLRATRIGPRGLSSTGRSSGLDGLPIYRTDILGPKNRPSRSKVPPPAAGRTAVCPRLGHERGSADREVKVELLLAHALRQRGVAGHRHGIGVHRPQPVPRRDRSQLGQPLARLAPPRAHLVLVRLVLHCDLLLGSNHAQRHPRLQGRSSRPSLCHFDGTRARGSPP